MRQETVVTMQGVPLTSYMEGIIVNTVSSNSSKGRAAIEWIVEKLGSECRALSLSSSLDKLKSEYVDLKHQVAESIINPARLSIEELQGELKTELEKLSKFELAKLGTLELAKLRELQLSLPSPPSLKAEEKTSSRYLHLFRITFSSSQYKYCDRKTLNPKIIIYPIGRSQNVKKLQKKQKKRGKFYSEPKLTAITV